MEEKEYDYINVIPLVDVMLVLLTIALTTSSFIAAGVIPMELPKAAKSHGDVLKTQTIEIDRNNTIYLNAIPVTLDGLKRSMSSVNRAVPVLIRADRLVPLQNFVDVFDALKTLGFERVSLHTQIKQ